MSDRNRQSIRKYVSLMRIDHWIKQLFIFPGVVCALFFFPKEANDWLYFVLNLLVGFLSTSVIASANYTINEYLDAEYDRFHPTKKYRTSVTVGVEGKTVWILWVTLTVIGLLSGLFIGVPFTLCLLFLWAMGLFYNVRPFRTKDIMIIDVLTESVNNAIRLLLGWFVVVGDFLPPCSLIIGYWMMGAFLMAVKRLAEYRMIGNACIAGKYRKSFNGYNEASLICTSFFYAIVSVIFICIFLIKYRIELILFIPFLIGLYCYYLWLSYKKDSCVQKPEKLYHEHRLMAYCLFLVLLFCLLLFVNIPELEIFTSNILISI